MLIKRPRGWELPEGKAAPEAAFLNRRRFLQGTAIGLGAAAAAPLLMTSSDPATAEMTDPTADLYPVSRNGRFKVQRPVTDEALVLTYNNFYEFGSHKRIYDAAQELRTRPWTVRFDGLVEKEQTLDIDTLIRRMPLEERLYRLRCVEAWSMVIPWTGFPLVALVDLARPLSSAKYMRMETFLDPDMASGQKQFWYPWPYVEGLTMAEATNELAFMVTGAYGKPLAKQLGAPLRLVAPWKYGFKSIKSIVRVSFTTERPLNFWQEIQASEYGFWANVNPAVPHPRWSQASERVIGTDDEVPTRIYNGYGEFVAHLYKGLEDEPLFR